MNILIKFRFQYLCSNIVRIIINMMNYRWPYIKVHLINTYSIYYMPLFLIINNKISLKTTWTIISKIIYNNSLSTTFSIAVKLTTTIEWVILMTFPWVGISWIWVRRKRRGNNRIRILWGRLIWRNWRKYNWKKTWPH